MPAWIGREARLARPSKGLRNYLLVLFGVTTLQSLKPLEFDTKEP